MVPSYPGVKGVLVSVDHEVLYWNAILSQAVANFAPVLSLESGVSRCTKALVVVLPAPCVPLSHTIMAPDASTAQSAARAVQSSGAPSRLPPGVPLDCLDPGGLT